VQHLKGVLFEKIAWALVSLAFGKVRDDKSGIRSTVA
jgi:hypothetical protein